MGTGPRWSSRLSTREGGFGFAARAAPSSTRSVFTLPLVGRVARRSAAEAGGGGGGFFLRGGAAPSPPPPPPPPPPPRGWPPSAQTQFAYPRPRRRRFGGGGE